MGYNETCQSLTTTFAGCLLTTATETLHTERLHWGSASPLNPQGARGVGEAGTIAVAPAIASAMEAAPSPFDNRIRDLPITPGWLSGIIDGGRASSVRRAQPVAAGCMRFVKTSISRADGIVTPVFTVRRSRPDRYSPWLPDEASNKPTPSSRDGRGLFGGGLFGRV